MVMQKQERDAMVKTILAIALVSVVLFIGLYADWTVVK